MDESRIGIVCTVLDAGEADRQAVIFGPEHGRFTVTVKGARKPQSKLAGGIRLFCEGRFHVCENRKKLILVATDVVRHHRKIQENITTLAVGSFWLELLTGAPWPEDQWEPLFRLVVNSLNLLKDTNGIKALNAFVTSKIVKLSGLYPETASCARCGTPIFEGNALLDGDMALAYHMKCAPRYASGEPAGTQFPASFMGCVYRLYAAPLKDFEGFWQSESELVEAERLFFRILERTLERKLKTRKFLEDALGW